MQCLDSSSADWGFGIFIVGYAYCHVCLGFFKFILFFLQTALVCYVAIIQTSTISVEGSRIKGTVHSSATSSGTGIECKKVFLHKLVAQGSKLLWQIHACLRRERHSSYLSSFLLEALYILEGQDTLAQNTVMFFLVSWQNLAWIMSAEWTEDSKSSCTLFIFLQRHTVICVWIMSSEAT